MTSAEGAKLADAFGIPNSVAPNGAFAYTGKGVRRGAAEARSARARTRPAARSSRRRSTSPRCSRCARSRTRRRCAAPPPLLDLAGLGGDLKAEPSVSHTELTTLRRRGQGDRQVRARHVGLLQPHARRPAGQRPGREAAHHVRRRRQRDAALELAAQARARQERADHLLRRGRQGVRRAVRADVRQGTPTLGYLLPALSAAEASGKGAVQQIFPAYTCNPVGGKRHAGQPPGRGRAGRRARRRRSRRRCATASSPARPTSPAAPLRTATSGRPRPRCSRQHRRPKVEYKRAPRDGKLDRRRPDARGHRRQRPDRDGHRPLRRRRRASPSSSTPGGGGFGKLAIGPTTSASSRPSTSGSARRTPRSASRT